MVGIQIYTDLSRGKVKTEEKTCEYEEIHIENNWKYLKKLDLSL